MSVSCRPVTKDLEPRLLRCAWVPEQVVPLMTALSGAQPFLVEDYLVLIGEETLIFIGYPFEGRFTEDHFTKALIAAVGEFNPARTLCIAPRIPEGLDIGLCEERESDHYYLLEDLDAVPGRLMRHVRAASDCLVVKRTSALTPGHGILLADYSLRDTMNPRVSALYRRMPHYLREAGGAVVLDAWDHHGNLTAFFVLDTSAEHFTTYLLSCFSRGNYAPHASDLLFHEMMLLSREHGKEYLHLGLGVHPGIRRFKEKWGGKKSLPYEFRAFRTGRRRLLSAVKGALRK